MSNVRLSQEAHERLKQLAAEDKLTLAEVLQRALQLYEETRFFSRLNSDFASLRADPKANAEYQADVEQWDGTLLDGLDPHETWPER